MSSLVDHLILLILYHIVHTSHCPAELFVHQVTLFTICPEAIPFVRATGPAPTPHSSITTNSSIKPQDAFLTMYTQAILAASAILLRPSIAGYALTDSYAGDTFFGNFTPFTGTDPTSGFVNYTSYETARTTQLIAQVSNANNAAYLGVDHHTNSPSGGRASVRISSKKSFNKGLFIADISHIPVGCGTWPAFWLLGSGTWPAGGEIDIIEGVNAATTNQMTLHTNAGCSVWNAGSLATSNTTNCDSNAPGQKTNAGCAYMSQDPSSYGAGFNAGGGGVYATEWTSEAIAIWFFPRSKIPADISAGSPDVSKWGTPMSHFCGGPNYCDIDKHFQNMQIIFDTTFCGQWAGDKDVWAQSSCSQKADTCEKYVQENPGDFKDAFWAVNSVSVYQQAQGQKAMKRGERISLGQ